AQLSKVLAVGTHNRGVTSKRRALGRRSIRWRIRPAVGELQHLAVGRNDGGGRHLVLLEAAGQRHVLKVPVVRSQLHTADASAKVAEDLRDATQQDLVARAGTSGA